MKPITMKELIANYKDLPDQTQLADLAEQLEDDDYASDPDDTYTITKVESSEIIEDDENEIEYDPSTVENAYVVTEMGMIIVVVTDK